MKREETQNNQYLTKFFEIFTTLSKIFTITVLLLIIVNLSLWLIIKIKPKPLKKHRPVGPEKKYGIERLMAKGVYDNYSKEEIRQLLSETYKEIELSSYVMYRERNRRGHYVNVSLHGFRFVKEQSQFPPPNEDLNVFVFGGSRTWGYGVADWETIPSFLQQELRNHKQNINVFNFGRGYYYSTQERILLEKLITRGADIDVVVFIDGGNEKGIEDKPSLMGKIKRRFEFKPKPPPSLKSLLTTLIKKMPMTRLSVSLKNKVFEVNDNIRDSLKKGVKKERLLSKDEAMKGGRELLSRYMLNKKMVDAICSKFGIKCFYVWEPNSRIKYDQEYHPFAIKNRGSEFIQKYSYQYMKEYVETHQPNDILYLGDIQKDLKRILYIDGVHYNPFMNRLIAGHLAKWMKPSLGLVRQ